MSQEISELKSKLENLIIKKELLDLEVMRLKYNIRENKTSLNKLKRQVQLEKEEEEKEENEENKEFELKKEKPLEVRYINHKSKKVLKDGHKINNK